MAWSVPLEEVLKKQITKVDNTLTPPGYQGDAQSLRIVQKNIALMIDVLGQESAAAQGLNRVITTADKLKECLNQFVYILKDESGPIGMLKVGPKNLYLFDENHQVHLEEPWCILDFYVVPTRQRQGYGKLLLDNMLKELNLSPHEIAIDGPSIKLEKFLNKNYGVERLLHQSNNFAISSKFFTTAHNPSRSGRSTPVQAPIFGRFAAYNPGSSVGNIIHGGDCTAESNGKTAVYSEADKEPNYETEEDPKHEICESEETYSEMDLPSAITPQSDARPDCTEVKQVDPQKPSERPSTLEVVPVTETPTPVPSAAGSNPSRRASQLTKRGHFDVKFYHNKLW